ncbi:hypothetical protein C0991_007621 [Blastosporella zonata]|nr:hypothetical protein C0991_007621 [Blastosporella zonata]
MPDSVRVRDQFRGYRHPFVFGIHFLGGIGDYPRTLTELAMSQFSAELRRIPEWWKLRLDMDVRKKWAQTARECVWDVRTPSSSMETSLSEKQIQYILDELEGYALLYDHKNSCQVSSFERIWELTLPPASPLASSLHSSLTHLRGVVSVASGKHAYLLDPYSYPFVYNRTLVRTSHSKPRLFRLSPPSGGDIYSLSKHAAFLPTIASISPSGAASLTSYINNLHPRTHAALYESLAELLTHFVPLFEHVLTDLHRNNPLHQRIPAGPRYTVWDDPEEPVHSDDEEGWAKYESDVRHWVMHRPIELPDVPLGGYKGGMEMRRERVNLKGREVGVVLGVEEVRLEPGGEGFSGEKWHVEGMRNERIVACGIYFVNVENITQPALHFRMATTYPRFFSAGDTGATLRTWGLHDHDASHQHIPSRPIVPSLAIAYPNLYQSSISPFSVLDPTRPGRLTFIRIGLVDPEFSPPTSDTDTLIPTTREVAPQQESWMREVLSTALNARGVPQEIVELVMEEVVRCGGVMTNEAAEEQAERLREAREVFRKKNDLYHFCIPFDAWSVPEAQL